MKIKLEDGTEGSKNLMKLTQNGDVKIIDKKDKWNKVEVDSETSGWIIENDLIIGDLRDGMAVTATILVSEKKDIVKYYSLGEEKVTILNNVSLDIKKGRICIYNWSIRFWKIYFHEYYWVSRFIG